MDGLQWTEIYLSQFWRLRSQDQGHGQFSVWWEPAFWFTDNHFLSSFSHDRRGENTLWGIFYKGISVAWLWFNCPKFPPPNDITLDYLFQHMNGGIKVTHLYQFFNIAIMNLHTSLCSEFCCVEQINPFV